MTGAAPSLHERSAVELLGRPLSERGCDVLEALPVVVLCVAVGPSWLRR